MIGIKINHRLLLRRPANMKIAAVLVFAMFLNILNLGAFASLRNLAMPKAALKLENELGRIYSAVNFPVKIVNDMFKKNTEMSGSGKEKNENVNNKLFALLIPVKQTKKSENVLRQNALVPLSSGALFKPGVFILSGAPSPGYYSMFNHSPGIVIIKLMLLLLLLLVLPRGIPVKIKNLVNIIFACPAFVVNKGGIFHFTMECKGRLK